MSWQEFIKRAVPYVAVLLVGVAVGWEMKPDQVKVEERLKVVEVEKQVVVEKETVRVEVVRVKDTQVVDRWHREKTETRSPDGTYTSKEVEDRNIDTLIKEKDTSTEVRVVEVEKQVFVDRFVDKERLVTPEPTQWRVGAIGGLIPEFTPRVGVQAWVVGAEIERRIIGPFSVGVWGAGTTTGQGLGGLKLGMEF